MSELIEFLNTQIDEDEHFARRTHSSEWTFDKLGQLLVNQGQTISKIANLGVDNFGQHIARHDPARVLREVKFKRWLLDQHTDQHYSEGGLCVVEGMEPCTQPEEEALDCHWCGIARCDTVLGLATLYADRPGWKEEWRVS